MLRSNQLSMIVWSIFFSFLLVGCKGSDDDNSVSLPVLPSITLTSSTQSVEIDSEFELTWSVSFSDSCSASGDWNGDKPNSGSETITESQPDNKVYTLSCSGSGGDNSVSIGIDITDSSYQLWDYTDIVYGADDPDRQWLNIHLAYDQSKPSPVYLFAHANGGTAYSMSEKQLNTIASEGYTTISWESIPTINNSADLNIAVADAQVVFDWIMANAESYNLDPTHIVIGGRSRGSIVSWQLAHSDEPAIKGIYMYNALPQGAWQDTDNWNPVDEVTTNSPQTYLVYGPDFDDDDGHNPIFVEPVLERYDELGIGDRMTRYVDMWGDFQDGSGNWINDGEIMHYFSEFVATLTQTNNPTVIVQRTTEQIELVDEGDIAVVGLTLESDFYRNYAYECGLSGNYTFMVVNPAGGDENTEAPLWVYAHGGGAGYFDENGEYIALERQDENTLNHEETFAALQKHLLIRSHNDDGSSNNTTLPRRMAEGYRILMLALCDHDHYSGIGTLYPNNPFPDREVNGMQATMAAVEHTIDNYPTTHVWAHGTSAGSLGVYNLAISFAAENMFLTGVIADHVVATPRTLETLPPYVGMDGSPYDVGFDPEAYNEKVGLFNDLDSNLHAEAQIPAGFDEVPILFMGGRDDPFCHGNFPAVPAAAEMDLNNCEYAYDGIAQVVAEQPDSPHQVTLFDGGHVPSIKKQDASDAVDEFINKVIATNPPEFSPKGYKSLFMGHSFFAPIAREKPFHAEQLGLNNHTQHVEFSGGETGTPIALWEDEEHRSNIQAELDTEEIELFGMTASPTIEGYTLWIDYALSKNPNTKFMIGTPWLDFPEDYSDAASYESIIIDGIDTKIQIDINTLRGLYPDIEIISVPYAFAAIELRHMFEAGQLPGVTDLIGENPETSLFKDEKGHGHADSLLLDLAEFIWLVSIYDIDLDTYDYEAGHDIDLKEVAKSILDKYAHYFYTPDTI